MSTNTVRYNDRPVGTCDACGKNCFYTRKAARKWSKSRFPADTPRPYRCTTGDTPWWHVGHLPPAIRKGIYTRADRYGTPRQETDPVMTTPTDPYAEILGSINSNGRLRQETTTVTTVNPAPRTAVAEALERATRNARQASIVLADTTAHPADNYDANSTVLDVLFADLATYRFVPQVRISPPLARRLIELNSENNRNLLVRTKERYARDMRNGKWREKTGQVITIDTNGRIINGQHRLHAIVESGVTLRFDLCFGVEPQDIVVIDALKARDTNAIIRVAGGRDLSGVGAIVRWLLSWERGQYTGTSGNFTPTPIEIYERVEAEPDVFAAAAARGKDAQNRNLAPNRVAGMAYYLFRAIDIPEADDFFDQFVSGIYNTSDPDTSAIYRLREKMLRRRALKLDSATQLALIITAWNRHHKWVRATEPDSAGNYRVRREPVERLQPVKEGNVTNANFPQPVKPHGVA